jgi:ABC-type transporter Mla subunit MlaD
MAEEDSGPRPQTSGPGDQDKSGSSVRISGGSFSGNIALGNIGPVTQLSQAAEAGRLAQIEDLLSQLETGLRGIGSSAAEDALDDVDGVRNELARRRPERARLSQLLARIGEVVGPVSSLLEVADRAKDLIMAVVH